jgi:glycerol-3-phosphate acyltransferase PlsY
LTIALPALVIVLGYLLGSIPSAYLIGRFWGKIDLLEQGDAHLSATAIYREMGRVPFAVALIADFAKGFLAVYLAVLLVDAMPIVVAAAYAAVIGHCWSVFLRFRGGLGAVVSYGVLCALGPWAFLAGAITAIIFLFTTRKSTLSTYVLLGVTSVTLLALRAEIILILFPLGLVAIPFLKRFQTRRTNTSGGYRNELAEDLKKLK